jgi:transcriptional regulator with XRE-family HTH domain
VKRTHQPPPDSFRLPGELGKRLKRLRQAQGLSQARVAERMGRTGEGGASICSRLEAGRVARPSLGLVADYLRACRAGFRDVLDLLDAYTTRQPADEAPGREAVRRLARNLPARTARRILRYDVKTTVDRRQKAERPLPVRRRLARARNLARSQAEYGQVSALLRSIESKLGAEPTMVLRQLVSIYGHNVWGILKRTRGPRLDRRLPLLARARQFALRQGILPEEKLELIQDAVVERFRHEELAGSLDRPAFRPRRKRSGPRVSRRVELPPDMKQRELAVAVALQEANRPLMAERASIELQMRWSKWLRGLVDVGFATRAGDGARDARVAETARSAPDPSRCPELAAIFFTVLDKFRPKT